MMGERDAIEPRNIVANNGENLECLGNMFPENALFWIQLSGKAGFHRVLKPLGVCGILGLMTSFLESESPSCWSGEGQWIPE